jgi:hypothetical protein
MLTAHKQGFASSRATTISIAERKGERLTTALEYQVGTENVAVPGSPRALWM